MSQYLCKLTLVYKVGFFFFFLFFNTVIHCGREWKEYHLLLLFFPQHQLRLLEAQKRNQEVILRRKTEEVLW